MSKSIPNSAQYVTLQNTPINDKPPGPIRNREQQSDHNYYTSLAGVRLCCAFYQPQQIVKQCCAKTILLRQTSMF
jgi:hypothetical protein